MFGRRTASHPAKFLKLIGSEHWPQGEALRVASRPPSMAVRQSRRLVLCRQEIGALKLEPMRWGLALPAETGEPNRPLNSVRVETVIENRDWRRLLNARRCIVPASQFFEWRKVNDKRVREYAFRYRSKEPMLMAGLWTRHNNGETGFAYISCASNELVSLVSPRMPVILPKSALAAWMNPDSLLETLVELMRPLPSEHLTMAPVTEPVEQLRIQQPTLFERLAA